MPEPPLRMGPARSLLFAAALLLGWGMVGTGRAGEEVPHRSDLAADAAATEQSIPEPSTFLFAGLGGLILLLFAIRRKG